ncbi:MULTISPECIES: hypothetical protein [Aerococcus]|uniref:Uncharacterized protein n=4 Tax=Aerococcus TaxID=1375 RepID=A0A329PY13_9LACT|nr:MULTISPECIES: hypothetical protein [Aerococcus]MDK7248845.1 hypothetical protein [Corynebacterium amycolatum]KAA9242194.1 hypothetical protein F6I34_01705 [Aerococcus urinae]KAA9298675.1 hypothetical protein F6I08_04860 [Aerococcus tenax]MCY3026193.1 hypothetical protein [Aerococcus loyolae]MCY3035195.1 hypothetical protein [Aerococcus mictus]
MKATLEIQTKYFTTTEEEGEKLIRDVKEKACGEVTKQEITTKKHPDYGPYYEVKIVESITTSRSILENGF